jgi:hypothetical protein
MRVMARRFVALSLGLFCHGIAAGTKMTSVRFNEWRASAATIK